MNQIIIFLALLIFPLQILVAGTREEQRKYIATETNSALDSFLKHGGRLDGITMKQHSVYTYTDIYLDTLSWQLFDKKLSLRMRRRQFTDGSRTYGFQLKSEMSATSTIRMEIEETDLMWDYRVKGKKLTDYIDRVIDAVLTHIETNPLQAFTSSDDVKSALSWIVKWLVFKQGAAVEPLQELRYQFNNLLHLTPVVVGRSTRIRSHLWVDPSNTEEDLVGLPASEKTDDLPSTLAKEVIWTAEGSYDHALFYALAPTQNARHELREFELENKYRPPLMGTILLDRFEAELMKKYPIKSGLDSKYRQTIKALFNKND